MFKFLATTTPNPFGPRPGIKTDIVSSSSYTPGGNLIKISGKFKGNQS